MELKFTKLLTNYLEALNESPQQISNFNSIYENLNNILFNQEIAKSLKQQTKPIFTFIDQINLKWLVYFHDARFFVVGDLDNFIGAAFGGEEKGDHGYQCRYVWQSNRQYELARETVFSFFLKRFTYFESDDIHTESGKKYWIKLITEALNKHLICVSLDNKTKIETPIKNISEIDQYYTTDERSFDTFKIYSK